MNQIYYFIPFSLYLLYLFITQKISYHNNILDKLILVCLVLFYFEFKIEFVNIMMTIVILILYYHQTKVYEGMESDINVINDVMKQTDSKLPVDDRKITSDNLKPKHNIEIVVARYNEKLNWIKNTIFEKYPTIIYNKGSNYDFSQNKNSKIVKLKNVGKCDHTYLYHIIHNYNNLADVTLFLPGSNDIDYKYNKTMKILSEIEQEHNTVMITSYYNNVKKDLYNFKLNSWKSSYRDNLLENPEHILELSQIRPFGKWFESHFGDIHINHISYWGIMAISKEHILQRPKSYYEKLIKELSNSSNPEVGHYFERSWEAVFYPLSNAKFILDNTKPWDNKSSVTKLVGDKIN
jgi:hypothetical protein